ncbi:MAG TPA: cupin domain-containing protein, partial [Thermoanaerobaculia bacterium]|nr:cupin domain-containing protein [Thermoanaerobaculia bacterium]
MARKTHPAAGRSAGDGPRFPGRMGARSFLARHWQKRPLLVRGAFPGFRDPLGPGEVLALAGSSEAES